MPEGLDIDYQKPIRGAMPFYTQQIVINTGKDDWSSRIEEGNKGHNLANELKALLGPGGKIHDVGRSPML